MKKEKDIERQIVGDILALIKPEYLEKSTLVLQENKGDKDSIVITIENNPWRNGMIKGDRLFGRIKTGGKLQYVQIKRKHSLFLNKLHINYTANKSEQKEEFVRIDLADFCSLLENPTSKAVELINRIYLNAISFPEFGCCSKYAECEKEGKCLHIDQLYATACQWQKYLKRTGKFENI